MIAALLAVLCQIPAPPGRAPDYTALYAKGIPFAQFLDEATRLQDEWRENYAGATIAAASLARAQALDAPWRVLVVAEDWCHDSVATVPYLAKLADVSGGALTLRIINSSIGRPVMEANRTVDGRAATPTIVVLDAAGSVKGVIAERPAALVAYSKNHSESGDRRQWYEEDKGRHAVAQILDIIERR